MRRLVIVALTIGCGAAAALTVFLLLNRPERHELLARRAERYFAAGELPTASPQPVRPPEAYFEHDLPLFDRRHVAWVIIDALQKYYTEHGEFPPYLLGGDAELGKQPNPDPLIAGGYLKQYPLFYPIRDYYYAGCSDWPLDARSGERWVCMYSTPGDHLHYPPHLEILTGNPDADEYVSADLEWSATPPRARQYALGGRDAPRGAYAQYTLWPGEYVDIVAKMRVVLGTIFPVHPLCFFGYQRGEHCGQQPDACRLWLYGGNVASTQAELSTNPQPYFAWVQKSNHDQSMLDMMDSLYAYEYGLILQPPSGLDLLNAQTGELMPDGIPDGICLMYDLKHGKLVATVADPRLAPAPVQSAP